jgi:hypothetical protein
MQVTGHQRTVTGVGECVVKRGFLDVEAVRATGVCECYLVLQYLTEELLLTNE